jgi:hypothetical protein
MAIAAILVLSLAATYLYFSRSEEDVSVSVLVIDSWGIESGSYYPWIWLNSTDDRLRDLESMTLEILFSDTGTGEYVCGFSYGGFPLSYSNESWSVRQRLSFQDFSPAEYLVDVYLNCTFGCFESPVIHANAHVQGNMNLPSEQPPLPRVLGIMFFPTEDEGIWHYNVSIEDPDQDGDCAGIYASNRSGYTIWHVLTNNTDYNLIWVIEGDADLSQKPSSILVQVTDEDGPYADARFYP